ncbi:MAG: DUF423 domain-containing protein [Opitutaceae bacterium]|nr:DUF423 domain-containing protein [Opitutaceae bacterium]
MPTLGRRSIVFATSAGFSAVGLGAFGAHRLRPMLEAHSQVATWNTAVHYHLLHSVVLLALALYLSRDTPPATARRLGHATALFAAGIALFSGSLYLLALGGPRWLGPITPVGGLCLLAGWLTVGWALWRPEEG